MDHQGIDSACDDRNDVCRNVNNEGKCGDRRSQQDRVAETIDCSISDVGRGGQLSG